MRKNYNLNIALKLLLSFTAAVLIIFAPRFEVHASINLTGAPLSPNTDTQILLEWDSASGVSYYELHRNGELLVDRIEDTGANLSYIDGNDEILVPETRYDYEVRAYDKGGNELPAERESVSVVTTRMLKPTDLSYIYNINNGNVTIRWKNNSLAAAGTSISLLPGTGSSREVAFVCSKAEEHTLTGQNLTPDIPVQYAATSYNEDKSRSSDPSSILVLPINSPSLSVSASGNMVNVSWRNYAHISNFNLQRRKLSGSAWTAWQNISTNLSGTSINDTLPSGGYYDYRLIAKGSYSGEVVYSYYYDGLNILVPPSDLKCTVSDTDKIFLTWTNNSDNYSRVELQRSVNNGQFTAIEKSIPKGATSYIDYNGFTADAVYRYRLVVYDEVNNSFISDECRITISKPASPENLQLTLVPGTRIDLFWSDLSDNELEFRIERKTGSGKFIEIGSTKENIRSYSDNSISPGHAYTYRVRAYNYRGYSEYTNEAQVPSTAFETPNSLEVTAVSDRQVNMKWVYPISGSYAAVIERKTGAQGEWKEIATTREGITQYSDTGLNDNTEYFYRLRIYINENARSIPYPNDSSGIGAVTLIGSIRLYADAVSSNRIRLEWSNVHNKGMELVIERKTAFGDFISIKTIETGTDRWYDEGVIPQAEYTYRIKAISEDNESEYSNEVTVVNSYLDEPEDLEIKVISNNEIKLTWVDTSDSETGFEIWRYIYGYESYELYATVGQNTTSFIDEDVQKGLQYYYKVRAISSIKDVTSDFTGSVSSGVGIVNPPSDLKYTVLSDYRIKLTWKDNSDDESGFVVERKIGENGIWTEVTYLSRNSASYTCTSLNPHVRYFFRVRAYKSSYNSDSYSDEIEVSTNKANAPDNFTLTAISTGMVRLEWEDKANNETGYEVERRLASGKYTVVAILDANVTEYTDKNLLPGRLYYYRVRAFNSAGYSDYTPWKHVTTLVAVSFEDVTGSHWAREAVESLASREILKGKTEREFKPDDTITRAEFTALIVRAFDFSMTPVGSYKDVKPGNWHYNYVMTANAMGIAVEDKDGNFYPDMPITREDMAVMIVKALEAVDRALPGYSNSVLEIFRDKNQISPHAVASIASLCGEGVIKGKGENTIAPKQGATRAEAAVMLYRVLGR